MNLSFLISYLLSPHFFIAVLILFLFLQIYNFSIRNIIFLDIIFISLNFVIRAVSGIFIINREISPWVILSTFFISMFLVSGKRLAEMSTKDAKAYRPSLANSDKRTLELLSIVSVGCVFIFFSIYSIWFDRVLLLLSLPIALYITASFFQSLDNAPEIIRNPEKFIFSKKILLAEFLWFIIILITLYFYYP